jgi:hypothetical protein
MYFSCVEEDEMGRACSKDEEKRNAYRISAGKLVS